MGVRFRKSIKIAPGVKLNFNKKSVGATIGGKGAHYTINSKGSKTTSVGIPGTGISYSKTTSSTSSKKKINTNVSLDGTSYSENVSKKNSGCLKVVGIFLIACIALMFLTFLWIPGIISAICFGFQKNLDRKTKFKRVGIALLIAFVSLFAASFSGSATLTELNVNIDQTEFDIDDTVEVDLVLAPADAVIEELAISENDVVELDYDGSEAILSFKSEGVATIFFIANDSVRSNTLTVTVISENSGEVDDGEIQFESNESNPVQEENQQQETPPPVTEDSETYSYVLNTDTKKFHTPYCSSVSTIKKSNYGTFEGTRDEIINQGYEPCKRCDP